MKISVSSYSFEQLIKKGELTQLDAVRLAARMGFDGIEFTDLRPNPSPTVEEQLAYAEKIKSSARENRIEVVAYLISADLSMQDVAERQAELERVFGQVRVAASLGAGLLRHDVCYKEKKDGKLYSFDRMLPVISDSARKITEYASSFGIRTVTENHGFVAQDSDRIERLFNSVGHENFGLLIDMGNFACADEDSAKAVSRLASYAFHVHAKDFRIRSFEDEKELDGRYFTSRACNRLYGCAIGDGDIPVAQCLAILKRAGYDGYVTIEFEGSGECLHEIEKGLDFLKKYID